MATPKDEIVTPLDTVYLRYFTENPYGFGYVLHAVNGSLIRFDILPRERIPILISSQPMRYAAMAYASFRRSKSQPSEDTLQYLGLCLKYIHHAISTSVGFDLAYTCSTLINLAVEMNESVETISSHIFGLYSIMKYLNSKSLVQEWEWLWMDRMFSVTLRGLHWRLDPLSLQNSRLFAIQIEQMYNMLEDYRHYGPTALSSQPLHWSLFRLNVYIRHYFSYYLLLVNNAVGDNRKVMPNETTAVASTLIHLIQQFIEILPQYDDQLLDSLWRLSQIDRNHYVQLTIQDTSFSMFDIDHLSTYLSAILIRKMVPGLRKSDETEFPAHISAICLCKISALAPTEDWYWLRINIKNLFLAGLVLTKSRHPEGNLSILIVVLTLKEHVWIKSCLIKHIESSSFIKRNEHCSNVLISQFLDEADKCSSLNDVWMLKLGTTSLWQCIASFGGVFGSIPV